MFMETQKILAIISVNVWLCTCAGLWLKREMKANQSNLWTSSKYMCVYIFICVGLWFKWVKGE